ncbi:MAG: AI-2E family transporter [Actinobacteria bacterium]|nr:MAG: AI-2E family transporter [Actinomycetota bacterium]
MRDPRMRFTRSNPQTNDATKSADGRDHIEIDAAALRDLSSTFAPPRALRDLGRTAWLLVGGFALVAGIIWLLGTTATIVGPVVGALIVATVIMPLVSALAAHMPRAAAAAIVLVGLVVLALLVLVLVIAGITGQRVGLAQNANSAAVKAQSWLKSVGVDESGAASASSTVKADVPNIISTLTTGVINGIRGLASLVFGLSLAALSLFFLLKDGPMMRRWVEHHLAVPTSVAQTITGGVIASLRGYFRGVTIVAAFNGVIVGLGALLLDVPLAGTLAVVTFVTAYVPFIGAFVAGTLAVVVALGAKGATTAVIMLVIVILANGLLQNIVQPFAMGAALDLNPLVVLVATIGAGCIAGTIGLILAAPLLSAAVHISRDLARARAVAALPAEQAEPPPAVPQAMPTS